MLLVNAVTLCQPRIAAGYRGAKEHERRKQKKSTTAETARRGSSAGLRRRCPTWISGTSVHASLANEIGLRIVRGDYPPGTILPNEAKWSQTFEVSRSAVREAIKMLMAKSLLTSRPKVGSWVEPRERWNLLDRDVLSWYPSSPDREPFLKTVQEFRYIIEPEATALAAERRTERADGGNQPRPAARWARAARCRNGRRPTRASISPY